MNTIQLSVHH